jgi:hypothetical protein
VGLAVVIGLGTLLTIVRSLYRRADDRFDRKGGMPMRNKVIILYAGSLETIWAAAAGALQAPKG